MTMDHSINKMLYRYVLLLIKAIPIIMMGISVFSIVLSLLGVDSTFFSYIGGTSLLFLIFMYLSSIAFGFGASHRWFINYCAIIWVIGIIDEYIGVPLSDRGMLLLFIVIVGITLTAAILSKKKESYVLQQEEWHQKKWYKAELIIIKTIPLIMAGIAMLRTFLSYFGIDLTIFSFLGGTSFLMIVFMYLTSIAFRFCSYHRLFIHYLALIWIINTIDWIAYTLDWHTILGEDESNRNMMLLFCLFTGSTIFVALYLKLKSLKVKQ